MKKLKFIFLSLTGIVLMATSVLGSEGDKGVLVTRAENSVRTQLARVLSPEDVEGEKGEVSLVFASHPTKQFQLLKITGTNHELVEKFKKQLEKNPVKVPEAMIGKSYSITIRFSEIAK